MKKMRLFFGTLSGSVIPCLVLFSCGSSQNNNQQDTIYLDQFGQQQTSDAPDLSSLLVKTIIQIGFYEPAAGSGEIRAVRMPKTVEKVPDQLPSQINSLVNTFRECDTFNQDIST